MNIVVRIAFILALIGNLTLPQSVRKYNACCYDELGNLTFSCSLHNYNSDRHATALHEHHSCCDPLKIVLRGSPAPQLNNVTTPAVPEIGWQAVMASPIDVSRSLGRDTCVLDTATTGPPAVTPLFTLHSRLNL